MGHYDWGLHVFLLKQRHEIPLERYLRTFGCPYYDHFLLVIIIKKAADIFHDDDKGLSRYEIIDVEDISGGNQAVEVGYDEVGSPL